MARETPKVTKVTVILGPEMKRWLERKAAERMMAGRPFGERSFGAVIRDLLTEAAKRDEVAA